MRNHVVSFTLSDARLNAAQDLARDRGVSLAQLLRDLLSEQLAEPDTELPVDAVQQFDRFPLRGPIALVSHQRLSKL